MVHGHSEVEFQAESRPSVTLSLSVGVISEWASICFEIDHKSFADQRVDRCQRTGALKWLHGSVG